MHPAHRRITVRSDAIAMFDYAWGTLDSRDALDPDKNWIINYWVHYWRRERICIFSWYVVVKRSGETVGQFMQYFILKTVLFSFHNEEKVNRDP